MLTADQHARLPALLRDIVDHDRKRRTVAGMIAANPVLSIDWGRRLRQMGEIRASLTDGARHLYGRAPLRGDTGPGRPTAMGAR